MNSHQHARMTIHGRALLVNRISGQRRYLLAIDGALLDVFKMDHAKITAAVLLIWGADDPVFPVEEVRAMAAQLGNCAGFVAISGGKLFVHEEMPDIVLSVLRDFLLGARPRDTAALRHNGKSVVEVVGGAQHR